MKRKPEPKREARDWSVRGLPPPDSRTRAQADRLHVDVYDGRSAAEQAGLPHLDRWRGWGGRFLF